MSDAEREGKDSNVRDDERRDQFSPQQPDRPKIFLRFLLRLVAHVGHDVDASFPPALGAFTSCSLIGHRRKMRSRKRNKPTRRFTRYIARRLGSVASDGAMRAVKTRRFVSHLV